MGQGAQLIGIVAPGLILFRCFVVGSLAKGLHGIEEKVCQKNKTEKPGEIAMPGHEKNDKCCSKHDVEFAGN